MRKSTRTRSTARTAGNRPHRALLLAAAVIGSAGLFSGVSTSTGNGGGLQEADAGTSTAQPESSPLSRGAPDGAITLPPLPAAVPRPQPATPAVITGLAENGIPNVALNAYRVAATRMNASKPACGIDWSLLAAIGRVESNHGRYGGAVLNPDGTSTPEIRGPALDGVQFAFISDSDDGVFDHDSQYDRAVGPMQFIPTTWRSYAVDADGSGTTDPFDIDDASLGSANYLCTAGGDLRTDAGQRRAVFAYNHSDEYVAQVLALARSYATGVPVDSLPLSGDTSSPVPPPSGSFRSPAAPGPALGVRDTTPASGDTVLPGGSPAAPPGGAPADQPAAPAQSGGGTTAPAPAGGGGTGAAPAPGSGGAPAPAPAPAPGPAAPAPAPVAPAAPAPALPLPLPAPLPAPSLPAPSLPPPPPVVELVPGVTCSLLGPLGVKLIPSLPVCP
ncbi:Membrane-bound lytic murein transglycosylase B [Blastococcus fimeti]|nr:Membrane-bound lytic murein transglycosylase B [Blastococcus fimeti]